MLILREILKSIRKKSVLHVMTLRNHHNLDFNVFPFKFLSCKDSICYVNFFLCERD